MARTKQVARKGGFVPPPPGLTPGFGQACFRCGQAGHPPHICPNTNSNTPPPQGPMPSGFGQACFKCGQAGHGHYACPNVQSPPGPGTAFGPTRPGAYTTGPAMSGSGGSLPAQPAGGKGGSLPKPAYGKGGSLGGKGGFLPVQRKGLSKPNRMKKVLRDNLRGIAKARLNRLAARAGVKRVSGLLWEELRALLKRKLTEVISAAITLSEHEKKRRITVEHIVRAFEVSGVQLFGYPYA
jgi:histone H4